MTKKNCHIVNFVFKPIQLIQNLQYDNAKELVWQLTGLRWDEFKLLGAVETLRELSAVASHLQQQWT